MQHNFYIMKEWLQFLLDLISPCMHSPFITECELFTIVSKIAIDNAMEEKINHVLLHEMY